MHLETAIFILSNNNIQTLPFPCGKPYTYESWKESKENIYTDAYVKLK